MLRAIPQRVTLFSAGLINFIELPQHEFRLVFLHDTFIFERFTLLLTPFFASLSTDCVFAVIDIFRFNGVRNG